MRINNVSDSTSLKYVMVMGSIAFGITALLIINYRALAYARVSFWGFFEWLLDMFQALRASSADMAFFPWILLLVFIGIYAGFIFCLVTRQMAVNEFKRDLNVKYINTLPDGMEFVFTQPGHNFKCPYQDLKEVYMDIESMRVQTKNSSYLAFLQLNLSLTVESGKIYKLSNTTRNPMKLIYNVIDIARKAKNFDYGFSGHGEIPDYREKIEQYLKFGYKDIAGKYGSRQLKSLSIIFFVISLVLMLCFPDDLARAIKHFDPMVFIILFPLWTLFGISLVCDIILVVDAIRDMKFRGDNGQK